MKTLKTNDWGTKYLEQCPKISTKEIYSKVAENIKKELLSIELWEDIKIVHTKPNYWWYRAWFQCNYCKNKAYVLYKYKWLFQCRKCTGLPYKKQRYKWMIEEKVYNRE